MRTLLLIVLLALAAPATAAVKAEINTSDVDAFFRAYDAAHGKPTAEALDRDYIAAGTPALRAFAKDRKISGETLTAAIAAHPATFDGARRCGAVLPGVKQRLTGAFAKLAALYPASTFPPVTIVIGRGNTGGTTNGDGVVIGLETLCAANYMDPDLEARFVHLIAHEYVHVQQPAAQSDPAHPTVLFLSLIEGGAEFVGELISGDIGNYQLKRWTKGHEATIETAFAAAKDTGDLKPWLWNGPGDAHHPGDLGYWVGYRIAKAYYLRAADKKTAIDRLLHIRDDADADAFLADSGWHP